MSPLRTIVRPSTRRRPTALTAAEEQQRALLLRLMSLLLQYPDVELTAARPELNAAVASLPASHAKDHLTAFTGWFEGQDQETLQRHYVETFDLRRRSSLYLTYYLHGDTRRRGSALLALNQRFKSLGWAAETGELPDHLPVVLEFAALAGPGAGEGPLRQHRRGLELIHRALSDAASPYERVLSALLSLLPPATDADLAAVARLAAEGPPAEEVGMDPYGNGEFAPPGAFVPPDAAAPTLIPHDGSGPPGCGLPARPGQMPPRHPQPDTPPVVPDTSEGHR
jgi:nitrate reductase delta subunit